MGAFVAIGANYLRKSHVTHMNIIEAVGVTKSFYIGELHVDEFPTQRSASPLAPM